MTDLTTTKKRPTIIGLTGKIGSGKDTVFERLQTVFGADTYRRQSFAAPLKQSVGALLGITVQQIEDMKNEPTIRISLLDTKGYGRDLGRSLSMREFLQRYGTEAHRNIFGEDFWVDVAMEKVKTDRRLDVALRAGPFIDVFTDVRFENEALAIHDAGGEIWQVVGPNEDTGDHASEMGFDPELITGTIDNLARPDYQIMLEGTPLEAADERNRALSILDDELALVHGQWTA